MRYKLTLSYDGYNYMGFQIQHDLPTVELELRKAIKRMLDIDVTIAASGRTDRFVHALNQVIHFDMDYEINPNNLKRGINSFLPEDIYIKSVEKVSNDFHARFSAKSKEYHYLINTLEYNPLTYKYMPFIDKLDVEAMEDAIKLFIGTHDFKGFASAQIDERKDTVKTITDAKIIRYPEKLEFVFIGTGFLKYQVRRMMGLLIEIGKCKETKEKINLVLDKKDPKISHKVASGVGLYLWKVNY